MSVFVLDSNIVSYYLRQETQVVSHVNASVSDGHEIMIAPIAYYEILRGLLASGAKARLKDFVALCKIFRVGVFTNTMLDTAAKIYAELRSAGRSTHDADILIAAFCLQHNYTLVTHNTKHFEHIHGLNIVDWAVE